MGHGPGASRPSVPACLLRAPVLCLLLVLGCAVVPARGAAPAYQAHLDRGQALSAERHFARALTAFEAAARLAPDDPEPYARMAQSLYRMDRYPAAMEAYRAALARDPRHLDAVVGLWHTRLASATGRDRDKVRAEIRREVQGLLDEYGEDTGARLAAYTGHELTGDRSAAFELLVGIIGEGDFDGYESVVALALYLLLRGERDAERRVLLGDLYVTSFPQDTFAGPSARIVFQSLAGLQAPTSPVSDFARRYLSLAGQNPALRLAVARGVLDHGDSPAWAARLLQDSDTSPALGAQDLAEARYLHALALLRQGDRSGAEARLRAVLDLDPAYDAAHYRLGALALEGGMHGQAQTHFRQALRASDRFPDAEKRLQGLLTERHGYQGDPRDYFGRRDDIVRFSDMTEAAGLAGVSSGRLAWADYDNDGFQDLLVDGPRLFRNNRRGGFQDVTRAVGLDGFSGSNGGVWGDYDNDGYLDLLMTSRRGNRLLHNEDGGGFRDVTSVAGTEGMPQRTEAAAWGDMDNDGWLDLYLANYERPAFTRALCYPDRLLRNRGDGRFEDVTGQAGIVSDEPMCGRGVVWSDIDADGDQDILVSNYRLDPNFLWRNRGEGRFADTAEEQGFRGRNDFGAYGHTIGSVVGDLDNDGHLDVVSSNLAHPEFLDFSDTSMLLTSSGPPEHRLEDVSARAGIRYEESSSDPALGDVDNDGDLDLYVTSIYPGRNSHLYLNDGQGRLTDVSWVSGTRLKNTWGSAYADYDADGDLDLAVASDDGVHLLQNQGNPNRWLRVTLKLRGCNRFGVGSRVTLRYAGRQQVREVYAGKGTGTQDALPVHFGLGTHGGPVKVEVETPCGQALEAAYAAPDRSLTITD